MMKKLILASKSPYRKALLERLGVEFETRASGFDEAPLKELISDPIELTQKLSLEKAKASYTGTDELLIGSDQVCVFKGEILGKPGNFENATRQLELLSGDKHQLITSYVIWGNDTSITRTNITTLKMRQLSPVQIKNYLNADNPVDCAGAYKLELKGISLMESIETTDHTAITGLPLMELAGDLVKLGYSVPSQ